MGSSESSPRISAALAAAVGGVAASVLLVGSAHGATLVARDAVHDVDKAQGTGGTESTPAPWRVNGDLKRYVVTYDRNRIEMVLSFRALSHRDPALGFLGAFRWPGNGQQNYGEVFIRANRGQWEGMARWTGDPGCPLTFDIDHARNRVSASFPATCVGRAPWVRFNASAYATDDWQHPTYFYGDSAPGTPTHGGWSPRIRHGAGAG